MTFVMVEVDSTLFKKKFNHKLIKMNNSGNTLLAIIAGSAIGAALGILYAPDKGENTRKLIADQAAATRDNFTESAIDLKNRVATRVSDERETLDTRVESLVSDLSYKTEDVISTLEKKLAELKSKNKKLQKTV
ncbi:YtxH domain-containing protein [Maribacter arcticus]|uniref:Gas vesicle protein n=1 Tax=Maribacter arcticus TaxID=561365 RepID=A0A1T5AHQ8_9FLAO|nr:YtxH domain-containing protein [Maribacter arcticus]SKB34420.1 Gas vesicle protein [Maribacter arcticus]